MGSTSNDIYEIEKIIQNMNPTLRKSIVIAQISIFTTFFLYSSYSLLSNSLDIYFSLTK